MSNSKHIRVDKGDVKPFGGFSLWSLEFLRFGMYLGFLNLIFESFFLRYGPGLLFAARSVKRHRYFVFAKLAWLFLFLGCSSKEPGKASIAMHWQPIDSLNTVLPTGVRAYAGQNDDFPLRAWYVQIDEPRPDIVTRVLISDDSSDNRETVSSFAHDEGACVVVNGGYFNMSRTPSNHVGLLVTEQMVRSRATRSVRRDTVRYEAARAAIGFSDDDKIEITWVSSRNDTLFRWPEPPSHRPGRPARPLDYHRAKIWNIRDAVAAGPMLVYKGKIRITSDQEVFFGSTIPNVHPRTAAGRTADDELILMVVDGRQALSRGVSLEELAVLMRDLGAVDALNLDGGGSSALVVHGVLLNRPTGGTVEREVMSALATFCNGRGSTF